MSAGFRHYKWQPVDGLWRIFRPAKARRFGKGRYWNGEKWVNSIAEARTYSTRFSAERGVLRLEKTYGSGETMEWGIIQAVLPMERVYSHMSPNKQIGAASKAHVAYVRAALPSAPQLKGGEA